MHKSEYKTLLSVLLLVLLSGVLWAADDGLTLKVGDPAPKLFVSKWINGDPIEKFEAGKLYVVEFWATWCGPCRQSIPHLSEMNTEFKAKDVTFIGVNCREPDTSKVEPFVKEMGEKMNYRVAIDAAADTKQPEGKTSASWLTASGQEGIPTAFCVGKDGRIAWIGFPMQMHRVLAGLVDGTFDPKKEAERVAKEEALTEKFEAAVKAKDTKAMQGIAEEVLAANPEVGVKFTASVFGYMLVEKKDYDGAYAYLNKVMGVFEKDSDVLNEVSWAIMDGEGVEKRDYDLALKLALKSDEMTKHESPGVLDTLARAYFEKKDTAKAIELETLAIEKAKSDVQAKKFLELNLKKYQDAKK